MTVVFAFYSILLISLLIPPCVLWWLRVQCLFGLNTALSCRCRWGCRWVWHTFLWSNCPQLRLNMVCLYFLFFLRIHFPISWSYTNKQSVAFSCRQFCDDSSIFWVPSAAMRSRNAVTIACAVDAYQYRKGPAADSLLKLNGKCGSRTARKSEDMCQALKTKNILLHSWKGLGLRAGAFLHGSYYFEVCVLDSLTWIGTTRWYNTPYFAFCSGSLAARLDVKWDCTLVQLMMFDLSFRTKNPLWNISL